jgi:hypothetical protein
VSIVTERASTIVWVLALAYFVSMAAACPPVVRVGVTHQHGHASAHAVDHDGGCGSGGTYFAAFCPCGCGERHTAPGARSGVGLALLPATAPLDPPWGFGVVFAESSHAPLPPTRSIDHVPLPA